MRIWGCAGLGLGVFRVLRVWGCEGLGLSWLRVVIA